MIVSLMHCIADSRLPEQAKRYFELRILCELECKECKGLSKELINKICWWIVLFDYPRLLPAFTKFIVSDLS